MEEVASIHGEEADNVKMLHEREADNVKMLTRHKRDTPYERSNTVNTEDFLAGFLD